MASLSLSLRPGDARDAGAVEAVMAAAFDPQWGEAWTRAQLLGVMALPAILSKRINHGEARFKSDNGKPKDDE